MILFIAGVFTRGLTFSTRSGQNPRFGVFVHHGRSREGGQSADFSTFVHITKAGANHLPKTVNRNGPPIPFGGPAAPNHHKNGPQKRKRSFRFCGLHKRSPNTGRRKPLTQTVNSTTTDHDEQPSAGIKPFHHHRGTHNLPSHT